MGKMEVKKLLKLTPETVAQMKMDMLKTQKDIGRQANVFIAELKKRGKKTTKVSPPWNW